MFWSQRASSATELSIAVDEDQYLYVTKLCYSVCPSCYVAPCTKCVPSCVQPSTSLSCEMTHKPVTLGVHHVHLCVLIINILKTEMHAHTNYLFMLVFKICHA